MIDRRLNFVIVLLGGFTLSAAFSLEPSARAQARRHPYSGSIPEALRPSLDESLKHFVEAQSTGDWATVAKLLGRYRGGSRRTIYTRAHKECVISNMQTRPMRSFAIDHIGFSTQILSMPPGQRWWLLFGTAEFADQSGHVTSSMTSSPRLIAYRDRGGWYFTPFGYDDGTCAH
ncbi:MAG: hypothetical protein ACREDR_12255 [Blastocatellia bacterium]